MVKVMYNDQLVYKVVIWAFFEIHLWTEKVALRQIIHMEATYDYEIPIFFMFC